MKGIDEHSIAIVVQDIDNPKIDEEWTIGELCYEELENFLIRGWDEAVDKESIVTVQYVEIATIDKEILTYCFSVGELGSTDDNQVFTKEGWQCLKDLAIGDAIRSTNGWSQLEDVQVSENLYSFGIVAEENPILINNLYIRSN